MRCLSNPSCLYQSAKFKDKLHVPIKIRTSPLPRQCDTIVAVNTAPRSSQYLGKREPEVALVGASGDEAQTNMNQYLSA